MKYTTIYELLVITNSLVHRYLTVEESLAVEELNEQLLQAQKTYLQHRTKLISGFGGKSDGLGGYVGVKNPTELAQKLVLSEDMDIFFAHKTRILSDESFAKTKREVILTTLHIRTIKEHLLIIESPQVLSEKYLKGGKPSRKKP